MLLCLAQCPHYNLLKDEQKTEELKEEVAAETAVPGVMQEKAGGVFKTRAYIY